MSLQFLPEQLAALRQDAQLLVERAAEQAGELEAFVAAADRDDRRSEASGSDSPDVDENRRLLSAQFKRTAAQVAVAKRLLDVAHQQHVTACRLLEHLDDDRRFARWPNAVLVVDDYGEVRALLASVLEDAGFTVRTASNGLEAVIAAYEMRPGVILMDLSMPVLDGVEATRLIKAGETTRDTRVIAYTGNPSFDSTPSRALFAAVVQKPATPDAVLAKVQYVAGL
jgi:CheY-like chemotaxis protein